MTFSLSTQYEIDLIEIDGIDAVGFFEQIQVHEHLYSPCHHRVYCYAGHNSRCVSLRRMR